MNPDYAKTPREELEARLTALLLDELSSEEAAATRRAIERDAKLAEMFQQLRVTIELVQQASAGAATPGTPESAPLRLSEERRRQLFTQFQARPLPTLGFRPRRRTSWLVPTSIAIVMLAMVGVTSFFLFPGDFARMELGNDLLKRAPLSVTPLPGQQMRGDPEGAEAWNRQASSTERQVSFGDLAAAKELAATPKSPPGRAARAGSAIVLPSPESTERYETAGGLDVAEREKVNLFYSWHAETHAGAGREAASKSESELAFVQEGIAPNYSARAERGFLTVQPPGSGLATVISGPSPVASSDGRQAVPATDSFSAGSATYGGFGRGEPLQESDQRNREWAGRFAVRGRDSDWDKRIALHDVPGVGDTFSRRTAQAQGGVTPPSQPAPAPVASPPAGMPASSKASAALARSDGGELEPFRLKLPAPTLKGTPEDLPSGPHIEPPGTKPVGTVVLGRPAVGQDGKSSELLARELADQRIASAALPPAPRRLAAGDRVEPQEQVHSLDVVGYKAVPLPSKDALAVGTDESAQQKVSSIVLPGANTGLALGVEPAKAEEVARAKIALTRPSSGVARDENMRRVQDGRLLLESGNPEAAEKKFQEALHAEPENRAAAYYLDLAKDAQLRDKTRKIEYSAKMVIAGLPATENHLSEARRRSSTQTRGASVVSTEKVVTQVTEADLPIRKPATNAPIPQPEVHTSDNAFSTFSLNVSDVSFKLAAASLEQGQMPDAASVRAEEFINAFDYRDPEPPPGVPVAFAWERARYPFAHNRDLLRFSLKTAAAGRQAGRPLNLVLLLDNSGSMERADRVRIIREALRVLAGQLQPQDRFSVIMFARTARLVADGVTGDKSGAVLDQVSGLTPQGGTNLEEAMNLGYATALRHYLANGLNRVVLLTDGAANLGNVEPESLKQAVEAHRKQGVALDCFGIGWEGFNDDLLEVLSRNGDGRYGFLNSPEDAATDFAGQLAGALQVAASDVKVQVEFNPKRVTAYRQIGYAKHQLTKEQFRDNTVDAAEIAAQEAGNALYTVAVNPAGEGPLCIVRCRFKIPGTTDYREHEWAVPHTGNAVSLEQASPAMRLAASASAFAEWLVVSSFAAEVTPDALLGYLSGVPEIYGADPRPKKLEWMIRQAKSLAGK